MPSISLPHVDRDQALNNLLAGIALEEAALAHIINADGEKLQAVTAGIHRATTDREKADALCLALKTEDSVRDMLYTVADVEANLHARLKRTMRFLNAQRGT
ncbi:hypothetical protein AGMMS49992_11460 [Clostridia bacterium]|nr:hypothetical protein AGMMS49992_11460 [Clostridia bacterium]